MPKFCSNGLTTTLRTAAAFALLAIFLVCIPSSTAQIAGTGNIQGQVADSSGAIIPKATIVLTNISTQVQKTDLSDDSGLYSFTNIPIGTYSLTVTAAGFQTYTRTGNVLEVGSSIAINVGMTIGSADQKVEVRAEGLALQTEDVSFKQTIDQTTITEMPLNGRRMTDLINLSGGSSPAPPGDFTGSKYSYAAISVSIAGGNGNTTSWRLDGGDNNDYMANSNLPFPFPDAVSQFSVESTALGPQGGAHSGGLVNVVTRSGTNSSTAQPSNSSVTITSTEPTSSPPAPPRHQRLPVPQRTLCTRTSTAAPLADPSFVTSSSSSPAISS